MKTRMSWAVGVAAAISIAASSVQAAQRTVIVAAQYITPPNSILTMPIWFGFHDGTFLSYQKGAMVSPALASFINGPLIQPMRDALLAHQSDAVTDGLADPALYPAPPADPGFLPLILGQGAAREVVLDTVKNRFFSYLARIDPSDDAFVGNEDPNAVPVFDTNGAFLGPIVIDIYGTQVLDAGVRQNDEQGLFMLDLNATGTSSSPPESLPIRQHPGFNGSLRNPSGTPVRILGGTFNSPAFYPMSHHYDPIAADFTQPNFPILRLRITRGIDGDFGGNWYSPDRSGEGFNLQISNSAQPTIAVEWYTYAPDGSGTPIWLVGSAALPYPTDTVAPPDPTDTWDPVMVTVELDQTTGGRFASTQNPASVQRIPWGTIILGFSDCSDGVVYYQPTNPAFPSGMYLIERVVPGWYPLNYKCGASSLEASYPLPVG